MLVTPPFGASSNIALWRAYSKPPVELVVADLEFFDAADRTVQSGCDHAEDQNGEDHPVEFENLASVYDQVAEPAFCCNKFTDDDADQTQTDVDL